MPPAASASDLHLLGIGAALASSASWAVGTILFGKIGRDVAPLPLTLGKAAISIVLLSGVLALRGFRPIANTDLWALVVSGLIGIALGDALFFAALRRLPAHQLVALMLLAPILTVGLAVALLGERPSPQAWAGMALCVTGIALVMMPAARAPDAPPAGIAGLIYGAGSAACMAVATIIAAVALRHTPALDATWVRMGAGAAGLAVCGLVSGRAVAWAGQLRGVELGGRLLLATAVVTFGGFWLSLVAIKFTTVAIANTLNSLEALFIIPLAAVWSRERPTWRAVLGAFVACVGIAVLFFAPPSG